MACSSCLRNMTGCPKACRRNHYFALGIPDNMRRKTTLAVMVVIASVLMAPLEQAQAAAIVNLSDKPQNIQVNTDGKFEGVTIAPYGKYSVHGKVKIRFQDREITIDKDEEYALWPNGDFGIQRRITQSSGFSNR
jgi:hypothetical protein